LKMWNNIFSYEALFSGKSILNICWIRVHLSMSQLNGCCYYLCSCLCLLYWI